MSVIYHHPEVFPPTLNAIHELSGSFEKIYMVYRPFLKDEWVFPGNVVLVPSGKSMGLFEQEASSVFSKAGYFTQFVYRVLQICRKHKPSVILAYDPIALFAIYMIRPLLGSSCRLWYHNHDIWELHTLNKYSVSWWAAKKEKDAFRHLWMFSLPSNERLDFFDLSGFKGKYFHIPNYPARKFYDRFYSPRKINDEIRIIFQGSIGPGHGIEELIEVLDQKVLGKSIKLVLKGKCSQEYKDSVVALAAQKGVEDRVEFFGMTSYREVPVVGSACHVGMAIFMKKDVMNRTLGTASNKIYEYAALGLPVIYNSDVAFASHLARFEWAVPVEVSGEGLLTGLASIAAAYEDLSKKARADFENSLNFETHFAAAKDYVRSGSEVKNESKKEDA